MGFQDFIKGNSLGLLNAGIGLVGGRTAEEQASGGLMGFRNGLVNNRTMQYLQKSNPELAQAVQSGAMDATDAFKLHVQEQMAAKAAAKAASMPDRKWVELADGSYGWADANSGEFKPIGKASKPNDYTSRIDAANQYGLAEDDPAYKSFILTGKMPKEDQQALTTTDKKAILEADDLVASSQNAIESLKKAQTLSKQANSGWGAGVRATIGNNLPDLLVPDVISSPESSEATSNFDNAVVGNALTQLKAIFGGAPTEGERQILLDLQGSSSQPKPVRDAILQRATEMAQKRLEFNQQRADALRGNTYYKPAGATSQPSQEAADPLGIRR